MSEQEKKLDGPDFAQGVALADIAEGGMMLGHTAGDAVLLARRGQELFAIGAECTITMVRSLRGSSWRTPSAVPGTTHVSV
jgi:hypothetical protein